MAAFVWAQSTVIVNQDRAPARSLTIGIAPLGSAKASLSRGMLAARMSKNPESPPGKVERQLANDGFAAAPLATSALPILIQSLAADGKSRQSERLIELSGELTRRNNLINAMLINNELKRQRPKRATQLLGRAMSVDFEARYMYVSRLAALTDRPGAMDVLVPMLGRNPVWSADYWVAVLAIPAALPRAAELRLRIAQKPWNLNRTFRTDFQLITDLASLNHPALAYRVARTLGMPATQNGELLTSPTFDREPRFVPFEWQLFQTGEIGATIDTKSRSLIVSSLPAASGIVARQIVYVPNIGQYRFQWKLSGLSAQRNAALKMRIMCVEPEKKQIPIEPLVLKNGSGNAKVRIADPACKWYAATLELDALGSSVGTDISIQKLSLRSDSEISESGGTSKVDF